MELDRTRTETLEQSPSWYFSAIFFVTFLGRQPSVTMSKSNEQLYTSVVLMRASKGMRNVMVVYVKATDEC
jgi:hypothetical protein